SCRLDGRPLGARALGPLIRIGTDARTYRANEPIRLTFAARSGPTGDGADLFLGNVSDDGTTWWLGADGRWSRAEAPAPRGWTGGDVDGVSVTLRDDRVGRHAWIARLTKPGTRVEDYSLAVYTIVRGRGDADDGVLPGAPPE